ncbi:response regulator transcription factor [Pseudoflavonifractor sp. An184]|uniref:winged helix-turn-helix domain-containing protein n=1 Tax=Pseudoflavonifractor sp. An184 TaxID=1965576 RepID=UPI000B392753|nr:response regulator transcription factor [Pseudoflavonifractor sp. An184]OUP59208.1 transcriptional regulator [Pseudoflavonifractor sp. An184]
MDEIIVIRAADPDGSIFKAIVNALKGKRAEVVHINAPASSVLRIGELEIHHGHRRVFVAGREVRLNHGEYAMLYCMASAPGQVFSKVQLYAAAWGEGYLHRTTSVENIIWRLRRKLESDPKHPDYIKTVLRAGYKMNNPMNKVVNLRSD